MAPSDQAGSYSTLSMWTLKSPSLTSTSFLQATGQAWQVGSLTRMCSLTHSPLIRSALSRKLACWALRAGRPPMLLSMFIRTLVP